MESMVDEPPLSDPNQAETRDSTRATDDEAARLFALHGYHVLDTPSEARFDRITKLLARSLDVPIALISLSAEHSERA
jgi:hypothetical protein